MGNAEFLQMVQPGGNVGSVRQMDALLGKTQKQALMIGP